MITRVPVVCPCCKSQNISSDDPVLEEDEKLKSTLVTIAFVCDACDQRWQNQYLYEETLLEERDETGDCD